MANLRLLSSLLLAVSVVGSCASQPKGASEKPELKPTPVDRDAQAEDKREQVDSKAEGVSLALYGPFADLTELCAAYEKRALEAFDAETLERWKTEGTEKYATDKKPFVPAPRCDAQVADQKRAKVGDDEFTLVPAYDGNPMQMGQGLLFAVHTEAGWFLQAPNQRVPWHSAEVDGPHLGRRNLWQAKEGEELAWLVTVEQRFSGHATTNCSSGGNGSQQEISLSCESSGGQASCRYLLGAKASWNSPRECH